MIEKLQNNLKRWGHLEKREQEFIEKAFEEKTASVLYLNTNFGEWREKKCGSFGELTIYRISPDYTPEPTIEECEVLPIRFITEPIKFRHYNSNPISLYKAYSQAGFIGFKFADGRVLPYPVKYGAAHIQNVTGLRDGPIENCTHVLIRRVK